MIGRLRTLPRPTLGELLLALPLIVMLLAACFGPRSAEPSELTEARVLVAGARLVEPGARTVCQSAPTPAACHGIVDGLDDLLAIVEPQLVACQGEASSPELVACEVERVGELRKRLPELRRLAKLVAGLARGNLPSSAASSAAPVTPPPAASRKENP